MRIEYPKFPGFEDVYLEDSYLLGLEVQSILLILKIETVLREAHPLFQIPGAESQYCYRYGTIQFPYFSSLNLKMNVPAIAVDRENRVDYGNIDELYLLDGLYFASGDWGELELRSAPPVLSIISDTLV